MIFVTWPLLFGLQARRWHCSPAQTRLFSKHKKRHGWSPTPMVDSSGGFKALSLGKLVGTLPTWNKNIDPHFSLPLSAAFSVHCMSSITLSLCERARKVGKFQTPAKAWWFYGKMAKLGTPCELHCREAQQDCLLAHSSSVWQTHKHSGDFTGRNKRAEEIWLLLKLGSSWTGGSKFWTQAIKVSVSECSYWCLERD